MDSANTRASFICHNTKEKHKKKKKYTNMRPNKNPVLYLSHLRSRAENEWERERKSPLTDLRKLPSEIPRETQKRGVTILETQKRFECQNGKKW